MPLLPITSKYVFGAIDDKGGEHQETRWKTLIPFFIFRLHVKSHHVYF